MCCELSVINSDVRIWRLRKTKYLNSKWTKESINMASYLVLIIFLASLFYSNAQILVSKCTATQFRCNDGTCISSESKCNGNVDCPDRSDEDFVICRTNQCKDGEFQCVYGACVNRNATCNGVTDCEDNSDELLLECRNQTSYLTCTTEMAKQVFCMFSKKCKSSSRQKDDYLKNCEKNERSCKDGSQIDLKQKCDGKIHCKDGSDESLEMCSTNRCFSQFEFRCKNGACVDASAKCNGISDCTDSSDELEDMCHINNKGLCVLPPFPKNGFYSVTDLPYAHPGQAFELVNLNYSCHSGYQLIGIQDPYCTRGYWSHDIPQCVSQCTLKKDPSVEYLCLPNDSNSGGEAKECEDVVDEGTAVRPKCREPGYHYTGMLVNMHCRNGEWDHIIVCTPINEGLCSLPRFPKHGYYSVGDVPDAHPGQVFEAVHLNYTCHPGYKIVGTRSPYCTKGWWSDKAPECIAQCLLNKHPSVEYLCLPRNSSSQYGARECDELVEDGTVVKSTCRENYYYTGVLVNMHCTDGVWDIVNVCSPQCGLVTSEGEQMVLGGRSASRGEFPWHTGIYTKTTSPYKQICGGSLISRTVVISAAHCFWTELEKQLPASRFAVAVGKLYRPWNNPHDVDAQKSDVKSVKLPSRFLGAASNFQDDIALLNVQTPFEFRSYVRPVCIDFDAMFSRRQLHSGAVGKVAGWGLTEEDGQEARVLQVVELPYVDIETCISASPPGFYEYITSDKICAGVINGKSLAPVLKSFNPIK